jgi:hypothetical protein
METALIVWNCVLSVFVVLVALAVVRTHNNLEIVANALWSVIRGKDKSKQAKAAQGG